MINEKKPSHLFVLPNGSHLSYALPRDKGSQYTWFKTWDLELVRNWKATAKQGQIRIGLWSSRSDQHVIAVDIDKLPEGYSSFNEVRDYLTNLFKERAIVVTSFSGKAKAFIVVEFPDQVRCNADLALRCLTAILPPALYSEVDKHASALSITYANSDIVNKLSRLHTIKPYIFNELISIKSANQPPNGIPAKCKTGKECLYSDSELIRKSRGPFPIWDGILPTDLRTLFKLESRPVKEIVIRKLLALRGLKKESGFALPCTRIGRECETSHTNVSYWLRGWIKDGLLECVDDTYNFRTDRSFSNASIRAKRYRFKGAALSFAQTIPERWRNKTPEQVCIPESSSPIEDGNAYTELFAVALKFQEPDPFWSHVSARPNIGKKDRLRMAKNAISYFCPEQKKKDIRELYPRTLG